MPIFFVISGFLLYRQFLGDRPPALGAYARHRFLRIVPAYWVALTLLAIWPGLVGVFTGDWPIYYGFLQVYSFDTVRRRDPAGVDAGHRARVLRAAAAVRLDDAALVGARAARRARECSRSRALACRTYVEGGLPRRQSGLGPRAAGDVRLVRVRDGARARVDDAGLRPAAPVRALLVDRGVGLYVVLAYGLDLPSGYVFVTHYSFAQAFAVHLLSGLIGFCVVLPAMFAKGSGRLAWLGLVSYGIYLWHFKVIQELHDHGGIESWLPLTAVSVPITIALAAASYYVVERPALRFKDGFRGGPSRARGSAGAREPERDPAHP